MKIAGIPKTRLRCFHSERVRRSEAAARRVEAPKSGSLKRKITTAMAASTMAMRRYGSRTECASARRCALVSTAPAAALPETLRPRISQPPNRGANVVPWS